MKKLNTVVISIAVVAALAAAAWAAEPLPGTYKSTLGHFDEGREGSSWPGGMFLSPGNVLHAESWDGSSLGGDWRILCPEASRVNLIDDLTSGGTGQRTYQISYRGGYFELDGGGPWGNGDAVYTAQLTTYEEYRTVLFISNQVVGSVSDHSAHGILQGYPNKCMVWGIANGVWLGNIKGQIAAPGYPDLRRRNCVGNELVGHYGDIRDLTISIQGCTVPVQPVSWGEVKAMYRD